VWKNILPIITGTSVIAIVLRMRSIQDMQQSTSTLSRQYVGITRGAKFFSSWEISSRPQAHRVCKGIDKDVDKKLDKKKKIKTKIKIKTKKGR
jgi:predicted RNA-binding protein with PIN domain